MKYHEEEAKSYDYVYYLVGLVSGIFTGAILDIGLIWALVGGVLGLLTAGLFLSVLVRSREEKV
jgi:hypothetical protein